MKSEKHHRNTMSITQYNIKDINPAKYNPRKINERELSGLKESIKKFGFIDPLIINVRDDLNTLVGGHQRLKVAEMLEMKEVPCVEVDLSISEEKALNVALNSPTISGKYDEEILGDLLSEIKIDMPGLFDDLNFDDFDIDVEVERVEGQTDEDEVPETPEDPTTKRGDVWLLGKHRLMCGDSTMIDDVEKLMNGEKADMVFTDPPYNQSASGGGFLDKGRESRKKLRDSDNLNCFKPEEFLQVLNIINPPTAYIFCSKNLIKDYIGDFEDNNKNWNMLIMKKNNPIPQKNNTFLADVEYLFCSRNKGAYWDNNLSFEYYHRVRTINVKPSAFGHPTEKQVSYIEPYFEISSQTSGLVLDFFGGSGTTMIACEKNNRKNHSMELDEKYCDVIINRWQNYTGKEAVLESTGETYEGLSNGNR